MSADADTLQGEIIAAFGRHYLTDCGEVGELSCVPRGKKSLYACGDRVAIQSTGPGQGVIVGADPRRTLFARAAAHRTRLIAANATQVAVIVAGEPAFGDELIARVLVAGECAGLKGLIALNKADLLASTGVARKRLLPFEQAGYSLVVMTAKRDCEPLRSHLCGESTVLVGQSGMGKSTIVNFLFPEANRATREISAFLEAGRHTTSHSRLFRLDSESAIIDSPGLREFGLAHLGARDIEFGFPEFRQFSGECRFSDCGHLGEPGCALRAACERGALHPRRLELFQLITRAEKARCAQR